MLISFLLPRVFRDRRASVRTFGYSLNYLDGKTQLSDSDVDWHLKKTKRDAIGGCSQLLLYCRNKNISLSDFQFRMITGSIKKDKRILLPRNLGSTLAGIRALDFERAPVKKMVQLLIERGKEYDGDIPLNNLVSMFGFLRNLSFEHEETPAMLSLLHKYTHQCTGLWTNNALLDIIGSMRSVVNSDHAEVRDLMSLLAEKAHQTGGVSLPEVAKALDASPTSNEAQRVMKALSTGPSPDTSMAPTDMSPEDICFSVEALERGGWSPDTREIVFKMSQNIRQSSAHLSMEQYCRCLKGFAQMRSNEPVVRELLKVLTEKASSGVGHIKVVWNAESIGLAMRSISNFSAAHSEVQEMIDILIEGIDACSVGCNEVFLRNCASGLRSMSSDDVAAKRLLSAITRAIRRNKQPILISPKDFSAVFMGLQGMSDREVEVREFLAMFLEQKHFYKRSFTTDNISNILYGLQSMTASTPECQDLVSRMTVNIACMRNRLKSNEIGRCFFGLQSMHESQEVVKELRQALTKHVRKSHETLQPVDASLALLGMRHKTLDCIEVRELLGVVATKADPGSAWRPHELAMAFDGLAGMWYSQEAKGIFDILYDKLMNSKDAFTPAMICRILYSLRNASNLYVNRIKMIHTFFARQMECSTDDFRLDELSRIMISLRHMNGRDRSTLALLGAITSKFQSCVVVQSDPRRLSAILYGLRSFSSDDEPVRQFMRVYTDRLKAHNGFPRPMAMLGLHGKTCNHSETVELLGALASLLEKDNSTLSGDDMGTMLYGLVDLDIENETVRCLFELIVDRIIASNISEVSALSLSHSFYGIVKCTSLSSEHSQKLVQFLTNRILENKYSAGGLEVALYRSLQLFRHFCASDLTSDTKKMIDDAISKLEKKSMLADSDNFSGTEKMVQDVVSTLLATEMPLARISCNEILHGFECDIVVRIPAMEFDGEITGASRVVNIEVDGASHGGLRSITFCKRRDEYLREQHGIEIFRLDSKHMYAKDPNKVEDEIKTHVRDWIGNC